MDDLQTSLTAWSGALAESTRALHIEDVRAASPPPDSARQRPRIRVALVVCSLLLVTIGLGAVALVRRDGSTRSTLTPSATGGTATTYSVHSTSDAALNWLNLVGLDRPETDRWQDRLAVICELDLADREEVRAVAEAFVSQDAEASVVPPSGEPSIERAIAAVQVIARSTCDGAGGE